MLEYIRNELFNLSDKGNYAAFTSALIPGCDNVMGVRQPVLKKYARQLVKDNEDFRTLLTEPDIYHEETLLRGYVIGYGTAKEKNFDRALQDLKDYVPLVNNWAVCMASSSDADFPDLLHMYTGLSCLTPNAMKSYIDTRLLSLIYA